MYLKLCFYFKVTVSVFVFLACLEGKAQVKLSPLQAKKDIDYLFNKLKNQHPGLYYYTDSVAYNEMVNNLKSNISSDIDSKELYLKIAPMISLIKDLHTSYYPAKNSKKQKPKLLPVILRKFGDNFFVHFNGSNDTTILRTDQLLSINDLETDKVYGEIIKLFGNDNGNKSSQDFYGTRLFANYYNRIFGNLDSLSLTLKTLKNDSVYKVKIPTLTQKEILNNIKLRYTNSTKGNFSYKIVDSTNRAAILEISSFSYKKYSFDIFQIGFYRKLKQRFRQIEKDSIKTLALDFRANGGGFIPNISRVLKYISKDDFKLMDTTYFKKKSFGKIFPYWSISLPIYGAIFYKKQNDLFVKRHHAEYKVKKKHHYSNDLFFLMDGGSYSATTFTLALSQDQNLGKFIGNRAGGAGWGSFAGTWNNFKLPNSKIQIHMPLLKLSHSLPNGINKSFFIEPDYEVEQSFDDFVNRKDIVVEFYKNMVKN
jgi:hypothetical protein